MRSRLFRADSDGRGFLPQRPTARILPPFFATEALGVFRAQLLWSYSFGYRKLGGRDMAYVPGFKHDVFISYAAVDNIQYPCMESDRGAIGWVEALHERFSEKIRQLLGGTEEVNIFFDTLPNPEQQLSSFESAARDSAMFIAVGSRAYVRRDWTRRELAAFQAAASADGELDYNRMAVVECLPLVSGQTYPAPLHDHKRFLFIRPLERGGDMLDPGSSSFRIMVNRLAEHVDQKLRTMRTAASPVSLDGGLRIQGGFSANSSQNEYNWQTDNAGVVLLAQATDDLAEEHEAIKSHLEQFSVKVLTADSYPQGGAEFCHAFERDIKRAEMFVQLLGPYAGKRPHGLPNGYTLWQPETAAKAGVPIMQWRRPDVVPDQIASVEYRALLNSDTVIVDSLQSFTRYVLDSLLALRVPPQPQVQGSFPAPNSVFIDAHENDMAEAWALRDVLLERSIAVAMPTRGDRETLDRHFRDCEVVVFMYRRATVDWVEAQLKRFWRIRSGSSDRAGKHFTLLGPPMPKDDIGYFVPGMREIVLPGHWGDEAFQALAEEISR